MVNKVKFKMGIYIIVNIINNKMYVGSSTNTPSRFSEHKKYLRRNNHHSILLQRAYNKYGLDNFRFSRIEEIFDKKLLLQREQFYLDTLNPEYNISKKAGHGIISENMEKGRKEFLIRNGGGVFKGKKRPEHSKMMTGFGNPTFGKPRTIEDRIKGSKALCRISEENVNQILKMVNEGKCLKEIGKILNLPDQSIGKLLSGKILCYSHIKVDKNKIIENQKAGNRRAKANKI